MKKVFYVFLILILPFNSYSMSGYSGDVSYRHISGYTYEFTVRLYTKASMTWDDRCKITILFGDGDSLNAERINGIPGSCSGGESDGVLIGIDLKESIYKAIHTFAGPGNYIYTVKDIPSRISGICNLTSSGTIPTDRFFTGELVINPMLSANSSVNYVSIPITNDTIGVTSFYDPNVNNPDSDSLYYELISPYSISASLLYSPPSASNSFSIDANSGIVTWNKPVALCRYNYAIKIVEYKFFSGNYYYVGNTMQEVFSEVFVPVGVRENFILSNVKIYPNPASNSFTIETGEKLFSNFELVDISGQKVLSMPIQNQSRISVNTQNLSPGIYFYSIFDSSNIPTQGKIVINSNISE